MNGVLALIGFMGAGKSTVGRLVAEQLGLPFVDTDSRIAEEHGPLDGIFAQRGEDYFRGVESDLVCVELTVGRDRDKVVALGGGAVTSVAVREALSRLAHVVWLDASVDVLFDRARSGERPLARDRESFFALYESRRPLYEALATAVVANGRDDAPQAVRDAVLAAVGRC